MVPTQCLVATAPRSPLPQRQGSQWPWNTKQLSSLHILCGTVMVLAQEDFWGSIRLGTATVSIQLLPTNSLLRLMSAISTFTSASKSRFSGFRSLWKMPFSWQCCTAGGSCWTMHRASFSVMRPWFTRYSNISPPLTVPEELECLWWVHHLEHFYDIAAIQDLHAPGFAGQSLGVGGALLTLVNDLPERRQSFQVDPNMALSRSFILNLRGQVAMSWLIQYVEEKKLSTKNPTSGKTGL